MAGRIRTIRANNNEFKGKRKEEFLKSPFFKDKERSNEPSVPLQIDEVRKELRREVIQEFRKKNRDAGYKLQTANRKVEARDEKIRRLQAQLKMKNSQLKDAKKKQKSLEKEAAKKNQIVLKSQDKNGVLSKKLLKYRASRNKFKKKKNKLRENFFENQAQHEDAMKQLKRQLRDKNALLTKMEQINDALSRSEITVFHNGTYSDEIRICALELLEKGLSAKDIVQVIGSKTFLLLSD